MPPAEPELAAASIGDAVAKGTRVLAAAGVSTPRLDAELLLAEVLGVERARLVIDRDVALDPAGGERYERLLERRAAREPVAYILGRRAFRHITLQVDRRVLIPRPETELLVEVGLELEAGASVLDVGTGSGALALALKDERPDLVVRGADVSADAVAVARENARRLEIDVSFTQADLLDGAPCDAVLANLPYVPATAVLPPDIVGYEPAVALYAGTDGLDLVRRLIAAVRAQRIGVVGLEVGPEQTFEVEQLLRDAGYDFVEIRRDLSECPRAVVGAMRDGALGTAREADGRR